MNYLLNKSNFIVKRFSHHHSSNVYQTFNIELLYKKVKDNNLKLIEFETNLNKVTTELTKVTAKLTNMTKELTCAKKELTYAKKGIDLCKKGINLCKKRN
jgi:septal ring factor EnvC (AmiA/AmiB activator)